LPFLGFDGLIDGVGGEFAFRGSSLADEEKEEGDRC
jgi:hypothetical protein